MQNSEGLKILTDTMKADVDKSKIKQVANLINAVIAAIKDDHNLDGVKQMIINSNLYSSANLNVILSVCEAMYNSAAEILEEQALTGDEYNSFSHETGVVFCEQKVINLFNILARFSGSTKTFAELPSSMEIRELGITIVTGQNNPNVPALTAYNLFILSKLEAAIFSSGLTDSQQYLIRRQELIDCLPDILELLDSELTYHGFIAQQVLEMEFEQILKTIFFDLELNRESLKTLIGLIETNGHQPIVPLTVINNNFVNLEDGLNLLQQPTLLQKYELETLLNPKIATKLIYVLERRGLVQEETIQIKFGIKDKVFSFQFQSCDASKLLDELRKWEKENQAAQIYDLPRPKPNLIAQVPDPFLGPNNQEPKVPKPTAEQQLQNPISEYLAWAIKQRLPLAILFLESFQKSKKQELDPTEIAALKKYFEELEWSVVFHHENLIKFLYEITRIITIRSGTQSLEQIELARQVALNLGASLEQMPNRAKPRTFTVLAFDEFLDGVDMMNLQRHVELVKKEIAKQSLELVNFLELLENICIAAKHLNLAAARLRRRELESYFTKLKTNPFATVPAATFKNNKLRDSQGEVRIAVHDLLSDYDIALNEEMLLCRKQLADKSIPETLVREEFLTYLTGIVVDELRWDAFILSVMNDWNFSFINNSSIEELQKFLQNLLKAIKFLDIEKDLEAVACRNGEEIKKRRSLMNHVK